MNATFIKPQWSPLTIALMVLGFVIFWPLGLAMLAYILWGEMFGGSSDKAEAWVNRSKAWCQDNKYRHHGYGNWRNSLGKPGGRYLYFAPLCYQRLLRICCYCRDVFRRRRMLRTVVKRYS